MNRKRILTLFTAMLISLFSVNIFAHAEGLLDKIDLDLEVSSSLDFYSSYLWRGFLLDKDGVIQPGLDVSLWDFTFSYWSSYDLANDDELASDEIDYTIDYTKSLNDLVSVFLGHTYYDFPEAGTRSREFYIGATLSDLFGLPIETSLTYYRDYGKEKDGGGDGDYVSLDMAYSLTLVEDIGITMDFGIHNGFNNELFIAGQGYDLGLSFGFTIPLTDNLTVSPSVNYSVPFADLEDNNDGAQEDRAYGGISLAYAF